MSDRPHILLFNPDQFRGDIVGYAGERAATRTPHLDRFVEEEGVGFNHTYCQNPVCVPSRSCFHTGWYPHTRRHRTMNHTLHPESGDPFLLKILRDHGYRICWSGKNDVIPGRGGREDFDPFESYADEHLCFFDRPRLPEGRWEELLERVPWIEPENPDWRGQPGDPEYYSFLIGRLVEREAGPDGRRFSLANNDWFSVENALLQIEEYDGGAPLCLYLAAMCRTKDWKYVRRSAAPDELYDLRNDPAELRNVAEDPAHAAILSDRRDRLLTWYQTTGAPVPQVQDSRV